MRVPHLQRVRERQVSEWGVGAQCWDITCVCVVGRARSALDVPCAMGTYLQCPRSWVWPGEAGSEQYKRLALRCEMSAEEKDLTIGYVDVPI